jgi:hypothetical protein
MVVINDQGMRRQLSRQMKFGTEASVAGGPVGLHAGMDSDAKIKAEALIYSRARGVFAGPTSIAHRLSRIKMTLWFSTGQTPHSPDTRRQNTGSGGSQPFLNVVRQYATQPKLDSQATKGHHAMIRQLKSGQYRLYSRKKNPKTGRRRNLGTFRSKNAAQAHERAVQYFKHHGGKIPKPGGSNGS